MEARENFFENKRIIVVLADTGKFVEKYLEITKIIPIFAATI